MQLIIFGLVAIAVGAMMSLVGLTQVNKTVADQDKAMDVAIVEVSKVRTLLAEEHAARTRPQPPSVAPDGKTPVLFGGDWRQMADHPDDWVLLDVDNEGKYRFVYAKREEYEIPASKEWRNVNVTLEPPEWLR